MIYYQDEKLIIRDREEADGPVFTEEEIAQGWQADISKYETRLRDQADGKCAALTAVYEGKPAGYIHLYLKCKAGPFAEKGWPIIVDFGVLEKYRHRGIGTRLMDAAERIAGRYADTVCLGVGLHEGYGSAQRMYARRGYIPDGSGVWYRDKPCPPYEPCENDDELVLFLSKKVNRINPPRVEKGQPGMPERAGIEDAGDVAALALELWPEHTMEEMRKEYEQLLSRSDAAVFLYRKQGEPRGFAQCQLRHDYVEGTETSPVGYLEGIYVQEAERRQGIARLLLNACEEWAKDQGCTEFASDCELTNLESQAFHQAVGFREANRLVAYVRTL